jgi:lipoprotein-anchoring transpeptidase ErfK/SrfK
VKRLIAFGFLACATGSASAHAVRNEELSVVEKAAHLKAGQFIWQPSVSTGPVFLIIDLSTQRALLYRDGVAIAASTISTGSKGRETPTGNFTILQKEVVHRSRTYDDASMPYMQRLTWKGVSMHAGHLPGYPASHGCIRLPPRFAKLLYGVTEIGTRVRIRDGSASAEMDSSGPEAPADRVPAIAN